MDWFLYDNGPRHERVKQIGIFCDQQLFSEEQINQSFLVIHIDLRQKKETENFIFGCGQSSFIFGFVYGYERRL